MSVQNVERWMVLSCVILLRPVYGEPPTETIKAERAFYSAIDILNAGKPKPKAKPNPHPPVDVANRDEPNKTQAHLNRDEVKDPKEWFRKLPEKERPHPGLNFRVLRAIDDGPFVETDTQAEFHSGDRIRLSVMSNLNGYLYVISRGPSGGWMPLFPNPKSQQSNQVVAGETYQFPGTQGDSFRFKDPPGDEHFFLLLSKTRVANLDKAIADLASPNSLPDTGDPSWSKPLADRVIDREGAKSKDVFFDHVTTPSSGSEARAEYSDYVVSQKNGDRVVKDFVLKHK